MKKKISEGKGVFKESKGKGCGGNVEKRKRM